MGTRALGWTDRAGATSRSRSRTCRPRVEAVVAAGGARFGEIVAMQTRDGRRVTWVYATDPDGNIVELQAWS